MERQHNKSIRWEFQSSRTSPTHNRQLKIVHDVYAPKTYHSDEETDNFYNTIDNILEKQTHYTIVMGDFNAKTGGQTNTSEKATGCFGLGERNESADTLVEWATSKNFKIMNTLNTRAERRKLLNKNTRTRVDTERIGTKKNTFQLKLKNRFTALEEHDDMDSLNENMTEMTQQSAMSIAKQTKKQKKPNILSEICKTIQKKARQDIRKHNLDEIRETIEASKSLKKVRRTYNLGKRKKIW